MITFREFLNQSLLLVGFDMEYYKQIAGNYADTAILGRQGASMYTVIDGQGNHLGVVGLFYHEGKPFVDVAIDPTQRGKGLLPRFYQLLAKKHGLKKMWAYVNNNNPASIKSHEKIGFIKIGDEYGKSVYYKDF